MLIIILSMVFTHLVNILHRKWKEAFHSQGLKGNLGKTEVTVSGGITKNGLSKSNVYPCGVCGLTVKASSVLCPRCGKCIHGECDGVKRLIPMFS